MEVQVRVKCVAELARWKLVIVGATVYVTKEDCTNRLKVVHTKCCNGFSFVLLHRLVLLCNPFSVWDKRILIPLSYWKSSHGLKPQHLWHCFLNVISRILFLLTAIVLTVDSKTDINVFPGCIRHATGIDSLLRILQEVIPISRIVKIHTPSIIAWRTFSSNTNPSRVSNVVQSYENPVPSSWSVVWTAVETQPRRIITCHKNDTIVGRWTITIIWWINVSTIYPSTWTCRHRENKGVIDTFLLI